MALPSTLRNTYPRYNKTNYLKALTKKLQRKIGCDSKTTHANSGTTQNLKDVILENSDDIAKAGTKNAVEDTGNGIKSLSNSTKDIKVIGRLEDTAVAKNWKGHDVLNDPNWTLTRNDEWINAGIKNKQDFYIASPMTEKNLISTNPRYPGETVFAREIRMLNDAGYMQKGDYFIYPSNLK